MVTQKFCRTLLAYLFTCIFVVFVAGCGAGGAGGDEAVTATPTTPTTTPVEEHYIEIAAVSAPIVAVRVGQMATLVDSKSYAVSSQALSYSWSFSYKPDGSLAELQGATTASPSFIADVRGVYMVQLLVSAEGVTSQRAVTTVVATIPPERMTGPFNHPGMSSDCSNCHNGISRQGNGELISPKLADHLATSNMCQTCHTPLSFAIPPFVDHQEVFGSCSECHNNELAIGKSVSHAPSEAECDTCHNTTHFLELEPDGSFDHSTTTRACTACHNGTVATGMTPTTADIPAGTHPVTDTECGYCHTTISFQNPYPDHTDPAVLAAGCDSCHVANGNGSATGQSVDHPVTNVDCATCHSVETFSLGGVFDHSLVNPTEQSCESCHNDSNSINAPGKASAVPAHPITNSDCGSCHNIDSFTGAFVDHTNLVDNCASCHGVNASGKSSNHMPTSEDCSVCHGVGTFTTGNFDHTGSSFVGSCESCHNNEISVGKLSNHLPTTADCSSCHNITNFADATFDHNSTDTSNCASCHNGGISIGKSAKHIPTEQNCNVCHVTTAAFKPAQRFSHTGIIDNCESCHNGNRDYVQVGAIGKILNHIPALNECSLCHNNTNSGGFVSTTFLDPTGEHQKINSGCEGCHISKFIPDNPGAIRGPDHLPATQDCDVCHTTTVFNPSIFAHTDISGNCESCHDGNVNNVNVGARGATATPVHQSTTQDCGACHNTADFAGAFVDHSGPEVTGKSCDSCHDGVTATGKAAKTNPAHVPTNQDCNVCHVPGTFATAVFDHTGIVDNCASCHDGIAATGKNAKTNPAHIPTSDDCSTCHITTAFSDARFDHQGIVDNCTSCHNGTTARGKVPPPNHVPTNGDCSSCHQTTGFVPATFSHAGIVNNCSSCHDGVFTEGKSDSHVPTNQDCGICHTTRLPLSFTTAVFNHTGIVDNCASSGCHTGIAGEASGKPVDHMQTAEDCSVCHTPGTFRTGIFDHIGVVDNCESCHNNVISTGKSDRHLPTQQDCSVCHTTSAPFIPAQGFVHSGITNNCESCHDGSPDYVLVGAIGKHSGHVVTNEDCSACHVTGTFTTAVFNHTGIVDNCASSGCHTGIAGEASGKPVNHLQTAEDCSVCHTPGTFSTGIFDHIGVVDNCESCHNNVISTGKSGKHLPTQQDCSACHITSAPFIPAQGFVHSGITNNCESCHDGSPDYVLVGAIGKHSGHVVTNEDCSACHVTGTFTTAVFNHTGIVDNCASSGCHTGIAGEASGKPVNHLQTAEDCSVCHTPGTFSTGIFDHIGVVDNCESCHNNVISTGKSGKHLPTQQDCSVCHITSAPFVPAQGFVHQGITNNCESCHDGSPDYVLLGARGATATTIHLSTNEDCSVCHNTVNFADAFVDHTDPDVVSKRCDACHDGGAGGAIGKHSGHVVTNEDCSACHVPGTFTTAVFNHTGIVDNCVSCHNSVTAIGKVPSHAATSNNCHTCHTTLDFATVDSVDHEEVFGNCSECHNGDLAIGKSEFHAPTNAECDDCHNTTHFLELGSDGSYDHSNILRECSGCHNGTVSQGKNDGHLVTSTECGSCHTTDSFSPAYPDHTDPAVVNAGCDSCHVADGSGTAMGQSFGHPVTNVNVDCGVCHSIVTFSLGGVFNHSLLDATLQRCDSCHNASTSINAIAAPDTIIHQGITTEDCGSCHNTDSFTGAFVDHTNIVEDCASCHDGVTASGKPPTTDVYEHMPTTEDCSVCHTPGTFSTGTFNHTGPSFVGSCNSCHNNKIGVGKLPNHIPTSPDNQDCAECHNTTDFADVTFDHASTDTSNCLACHDGNISTGKSVGHIATDENCSTCHATSTYNSFAGTFVHSQQIIAGGDCASCHSTGIALPKKVNHIPAQVECSVCHSDTNTGGFALTTFLDPGGEHQKLNSGCEGCHISRFIANPFALKAPGHLPTDQDCDVCHTNVTFRPSTFNHSGISDNCASCHDGNADHVSVGARGATNTALHRSTTQDCGVCHNTANFADAFVDHSGPEVVGKRCDICHDGGAGGAIGKDAGHVVTNEDCSVCHVPGTFANAVFNHTGIVDNCASCHDGVTATGKDAKTNPAHVPTSQDCSVCHITTAFSDTRFDHQGIVDNCASCHNGTTARGKIPPPDHVPTNGDCSDCHQTTGFIPATFDHVGIMDNCSSCHDGAFATGKSGNHVPTSQDCGICHTTRLPLSFTGAVFDHTGINNNCVSCHDGSTAIGKAAKTNPAHLETSLDCSACHTTATFVGGTWVHDASTANNCDTCHVNGGGATPKSNDHLSTNEQCDVCHTTNGWAPTDFSHSAQGNYPGDHRRALTCINCHKGSIGAGINSGNYPDQLRYAPFCAGCHAGDFESEGDHNGGNNGTIEQNKNCGASGCHRVSSSGF